MATAKSFIFVTRSPKKGSFGRKISLMLCSDLLKRHIANNALEDADQLFAISPPVNGNVTTYFFMVGLLTSVHLSHRQEDRNIAIISGATEN